MRTRICAAVLVLGLALGACATQPSSGERTADADDAARCPDPRTTQVSFQSKPDCWTDEDWTVFQRAQRARLRRTYRDITGF